MPKKLNCTNPESLVYQNELLKLTVLGGIKLEGLDRMRVTLKIELKNSSVPPVRHNLDLYNDNHAEKLTRRTAEKLEVGTSVIAASLAELTGQLEEYRLHQVKENQPKPYEPPKLSNNERKAAETFLESNNLLERTNELIGQSGVVGEGTNRLIMFLVFTSRKREQPLHIVSLGSSGTGKTHLQEKVGELIPEEDRIEITTLSENAFYYFGQRELKNKLILIEDLDGAENVLYPLRELQSKKRISKTVAHKNMKGETRTLHFSTPSASPVRDADARENVLKVITDNIGMSADTTWATVVSASDYYPFGLTMDGRDYQDSLYRYGFNGKEKDDQGESTPSASPVRDADARKNLLTVITDNIGMSADTTWARVVSASDYYPFGLTMAGRNYQDSLYRYGFNGKEKDDRGEWGSTNYENKGLTNRSVHGWPPICKYYRKISE